MTSEFTFDVYDEAFWKENGSPDHRAAERSIAGHIHNMLQPTSVVDVGCGTGQMLEVFRERGVRSLLGLESSEGIEWCRKLGIQEAGAYIHPADLRDEEAILNAPGGGVVDLVVCVEVAEHLPEEACRHVVSDICRYIRPKWLAFSGAVPRSPGGTGHINEHYFEYWRDLVQSFGTHVLDREKSNALHRFLDGCDPMFTWASNVYLYRRLL